VWDILVTILWRCREGTAKVADVGLAHVVHASHIAELDALGTFAYAAPELINGDKCNEKADIW
jgi:serine/threonine protein kinase